MAGAKFSNAIKFLVVALFFRLKLNNFGISSSKGVQSTDWSALVSLTKPTSIDLKAYRACPRSSQAGAILDSNSELGSPRQLLLSLLLLACDVSSNPGPQWKSPCGLCSKPVKRNQRGIQCDNWDRWFHTRCCIIGDQTYETLGTSSCVWICCDCNTANYSSVPCNSLLDSYNSPGFYSPLASQAESTLHTNKE